MSMKATATLPWSQFLGVLSRALSKVHPAFYLTATQDQHLQDLERLALVSPHLLEDVGFQKDMRPSSPSTACWRNGDIVVLIHLESPCQPAQGTPNFTSASVQRLRDAVIEVRADNRKEIDITEIARSRPSRSDACSGPTGVSTWMGVEP